MFPEWLDVVEICRIPSETFNVWSRDGRQTEPSCPWTAFPWMRAEGAVQIMNGIKGSWLHELIIHIWTGRPVAAGSTPVFTMWCCSALQPPTFQSHSNDCCFMTRRGWGVFIHFCCISMNLFGSKDDVQMKVSPPDTSFRKSEASGVKFYLRRVWVSGGGWGGHL